MDTGSKRRISNGVRLLATSSVTPLRKKSRLSTVADAAKTSIV